MAKKSSNGPCVGFGVNIQFMKASQWLHFTIVSSTYVAATYKADYYGGIDEYLSREGGGAYSFFL